MRIGRYRVARVAGGTWVGVLYCFGGGAEGRVGIQVNLKFPRGFTTRFAWRLRRQESAQDTRIPPATQASFRATRRFRFKVRLSALPWIWTWIFILMDVKFIFTRRVLRCDERIFPLVQSNILNRRRHREDYSCKFAKLPYTLRRIPVFFYHSLCCH